MDATDRAILTLLLEDSGRTATDLSERVNLSVPAVNKRIAKLRRSGVIERFSVQLNAKEIGKGVQAYILVVLNEFSLADEFLQFVQREPDILECYAVTGEYDYLLRVCATDIEDMEQKLLRLKRTDSVSKSHTMFTLMTHKNVPGPIPDLQEE